MCLILFAYQVHPVYKLIVAANRDEFHQRPTAPAQFWLDQPEILAGRDLEKMGTWMGVTKTGRFSALTNYRDPLEEREGKRSRGELVADALAYQGKIADYMNTLEINKHQYPGYNLLSGDANELYYYSNVGGELQKLKPGIYGVSNHLLDTEWPKVKKGKTGLADIIGGNRDGLVEQLFSLLKNADPAPDESLPSTGVSLEWERMLSPLFIKSEQYGTRSSTVLLMSDEEIQYVERVFSVDGAEDREFRLMS
ncbi:NRDE family protein [Bacillus sp. S3]|uniref:NRDE family protein n=1 Tax=Bacillus sp. S3 TaxID=486398 RepID=UPI00118C481E|nr:NRDE family protein [Bacillus sp. S3]QCJ41003.1 NRDE family protein [Bacillus sp. S3]